MPHAVNRRNFLHRAGLLSAGFAGAHHADAQLKWRTFEIVTRVEVLKPAGMTRVWIPAAIAKDTPFQKTLGARFHSDSGKAKITPAGTLPVIAAAFPAGASPSITVTNRVRTRNWSVDLTGPSRPIRVNASVLQPYLKPTSVMPTDGIVRQRAIEITRTARTDLDKARAIYDWVVENTYRNPKTRGCGVGDIRFMLESGDLGGKCADLNALYVGLARAAGLPARDLYGIRLAASQMGYKSLGASSENVTKAQHCRAEVYLAGYGWVPVDPADVRKVMLEEPPGNRPATDELVRQARTRLFGSWEMNWMAYNYAQDVVLPGSNGSPLHFFMYPQAETAEGRIDSLDPDQFRYQITSRELTGS